MGLYLVRQQNERLLGPLSLSELKDSVSCLEITTCDEISGNLGPWVFMDSSDLNVLYPEILSILKEVKDWGGENPTLISQRFEYGGEGDDRSRLWKILAVSMLLGLVTLAGLIYKEDAKMQAGLSEKNEQSNSSVFMSNETIIQKIKLKYVNDDKAGVYKLLGKINLLSEYKRESNLFYRVLPYVRFVYYSDYFPGKALAKHMPTNILRGSAGKDIPKNCHASSWIAYFKKLNGNLDLSDENIIANFKKYPKMRAFLWNSSWVKSRKASGWGVPGNIHHGCLIGAKAALGQLKSQKYNQLRRRVAFQLERIEPSKPVSVDTKGVISKVSNLLTSLSCVEATASKLCMLKLQSIKPAMKYLERQWRLQDIHSAIIQNKAPLQNSNFDRVDTLTDLDYRAEASFLDWYYREGDLTKAKKRLRIEYPSINFLP
jgi:hypothetical protein